MSLVIIGAGALRLLWLSLLAIASLITCPRSLGAAFREFRKGRRAYQDKRRAARAEASAMKSQKKEVRHV